MENATDDKVLRKLLEIRRGNPMCCFLLFGNSENLSAVQVKELAPQLEMPESEMTSAMRRLIDKGYLKYVDGEKACVFLSDKAEVYELKCKCEIESEMQRKEVANAIQEISNSFKEQLKEAKGEAEKAGQSAKRAERLTTIEIIVAVLSVVVNILIAIYSK